MALLYLMGDAMRDFLVSSSVDPCSLSTIDGVAHRVINDRLVLPFLTIRMVNEILGGATYALKNASELSLIHI